MTKTYVLLIQTRRIDCVGIVDGESNVTKTHLHETNQMCCTESQTAEIVFKVLFIAYFVLINTYYDRCRLSIWRDVEASREFFGLELLSQVVNSVLFHQTFLLLMYGCGAGRQKYVSETLRITALDRLNPVRPGRDVFFKYFLKTYANTCRDLVSSL